MTITLYYNSSEGNKLDKDLSLLTTQTGALRGESSVIDPTFEIAGLDNYLSNFNYAYIQEFNRYYFVTNIVSVKTGLWRVSFHVDVLYTYRNEIRANSGIIARNENEYDLKLNDGLFRTQQNPRIAQYPFPSGFTTWNYVIAIAGN